MPTVTDSAATTTSAETNPMMISASDILKDQPSSEPKTGTPKTETEHDEPDDEHEGEDEGDDEEEDEEEDEAGEVADEPDKKAEDDDIEDEGEPEDKPTKLTLDPELAKSLPPEVVKRWDQQAAGLEKVQNNLQANVTVWNRLVDIENRLASKATAPQTLKAIVEHVAETHGIDMAELLGLQAKAGLDEPEFDADKKLLAMAEKRVMDRLGIDPAEIKALISERQTAAQRKEFEAQLSEIAPKVIKQCKVYEHGFEVTKEMIAEAYQALGQLPKFRGKPKAATLAYFSDERAKHMAAVAVKGAPKGPEAVRSKGRRSRPLPDNPMDVKASDILGYS